MDCETFRKNVDTAPADDFDGRAAHAGSCADCAAYAVDAAAADTRIRAALAIGVPVLNMPWQLDGADADTRGTVTDIASANSIDAAPASSPWTGGYRFGLAASALLAATLIVALWPSPRSTALADDVFEHLHHEPESWVRTDAALPSFTVSRVMQSVASGLDDRVGMVTYATICPFRGRNVPHLVVQGTEGPVMLLFLENEFVEASMPIDEEGYRGVIVPVDGGSVAIVGTDKEPIHRIRKLMAETVKWRI